MARVVAELGRPETPDETAARKAESSRVYRASQNFRSLIAALIVTLVVVAVIVFGVPRGEPAERPRIDVAAEATALSETLARPVLIADVPEDWGVNVASFESEAVDAWTVGYVPTGSKGFLRVAQGFDADEAWTAELVAGNRSVGTATIDGIAWDEYRIADPADAGNVSYALATTAGADRIVIYGSSSPETAALVAEAMADGIRDLRKAS
ncbi:DUF4245 family protein [Microbacterium sp. RD1]|uniref:DUF4245 family protein n=1 Tax=Microbacterium sp. RD1 TaxID=3457313 RepID=UPI003FA522F5